MKTIQDWKQAWDNFRGRRGDNIFDATELWDFSDENPEPVVVRFKKVDGVDCYGILLEENGYWYDFEAWRCSNGAELVEWIRHLLDKNWVTDRHIVQLIDLVAKHNPAVIARGC